MFSQASNFIIRDGNFYSTAAVEKRSTGFELLQKVACIAATHDSSSRYPPPKCDPSTRVALVSHLIDWLDTSITSHCKLLWMNGAAGAGKSSVAQTFSEHCESKGNLLATFFFARNVEGRKDHTTLIATLAYQIAVRYPTAKPYIEEVLENDPSIFEKSLSSQMSALIVHPLNTVVSSSAGRISSQAGLIIIDGLDECEHSPIQDQIVEAVGAAVQSSHFPLCFLIASRRHYHIEDVFCRPEFVPITRCVSLDQWDTSDADIEIFLRNEFKKIRQRFPHNPVLRQAEPGTWPSDHSIRLLLRKASGQFVYASTVLKFLSDRHFNPVERLNAVALGKPLTNSPFGELDALYTHILQTVPEDCIQTTMKVLGLISKLEDKRPSLIEDLLGLKPGDVALALCDLTPLLSIAAPDRGKYESSHGTEEIIKVHHTSFLEFLFNEGNKERNPHFALRYDQVDTDITLGCLRIMAATKKDELLKPQSPNLRFAVRRWATFCVSSIPCNELFEGLQHLDLVTWVKASTINPSLMVGWDEVESVMKWIIQDQENAKNELAADLYELFGQQLDAYFLALLETYPDRSQVLMILALLEAVKRPIKGTYVATFLSISREEFLAAIKHLRPLIKPMKGRLYTSAESPFFRHFLQDEKRSQQFFLSTKVYDQVTLRCQEFIRAASDALNNGNCKSHIRDRDQLPVAEDILKRITEKRLQRNNHTVEDHML